MKSLLNMLFALLLTMSVGTLIAAPLNDNNTSAKNEKIAKTVEEGTKTLEKAERTLDNVIENPLDGIPKSLINKSEGIVFFAGSCQIAAGAFNGPGGRGIAMIHNEDDSWSNPFFITLREGRQGFQIGPQSSDIVLLFKDKDAIVNINKAEIALGSDVEVESGPVDSGSVNSSDNTFETEVYSYYWNSGLFSEVSLEGAILTYDKLQSNSLCGIDIITLDEIFYDIKTPCNVKVHDLIAALSK